MPITFSDIVLPSIATPGQKVPGVQGPTEYAPYGGVFYCTNPDTGAPGSYTFQVVDTTHGLPVAPQTGAAFPVTDNGDSLTVDGSVTANVGTTNGLALDATLTGGNLVAKPKTILLTGTGVNLNDTPVPATDVSDYRSGLVQITVASTNNGGPVVEVSNNQTTWFPVMTYSVDGDTYRQVLNQNTTWCGAFAVTGKYLRVRVSGQAMAAACTVALFLSSNPPPPMPAAAVTTLSGGVGLPFVISGASDAANSSIAQWLQAQSQTLAYNGSTTDRVRNNNEVTALTSAARTTSTNSSDQTNYNARGVNVVVDVTAGGAAGSLTVKVTGKDTLSGKYVTLASVVLTAPGVSTTLISVYPGLTAAALAGGVAKFDMPLPRLWRVEVTVGDTTSYTYSVGANYIL